MKKQRKYKVLFSLIITLLLIISFLTSCDIPAKKKYIQDKKPPVFVAVLYDGSGTAEGGIIELKPKLFSELLDYLSSGIGGSVRFNFISNLTNFSRGVEFFCPSLDFFPKPIKENFNSRQTYSDALAVYHKKLKYYNNYTKPHYDSVCKFKINQFYDEFDSYSKVLQGNALRHSSQIEVAIAQTMPFFKSINNPLCRKYLIILTDGQSNTSKKFKLNSVAFNNLGVKTIVIGLSPEKACGDWKNINYEEGTYFSWVIFKIINNSF